MDSRRKRQLEATLTSTHVNIVIEHSDFLIVEKPTGILVHPTKPDGKITLIDQIETLFPNETLAIINRLDRETSGLVLVSRHKEAASRLGKMTMRREFNKKYLCLVIGIPPSSGKINAPLDRIGKYRESQIYLKQGVIEEGYPAETHYQTLETRYHNSNTPLSLLEIKLLTGRLHQIRVHLSHIGFPVVGDKIYGPDETCYLEFIENDWTERLQKLLWIPRHALHAHYLAFTWKGKQIEAKIDLPKDLQTFWSHLPQVMT